MIIKREVTVDGERLGLLSAAGAVCGAGFKRRLSEPLKVLHIFPSAQDVSAARPFTELGRTDPWETVGCLALLTCALLGIGVCLI
jgi:hypothetical protein